MRITLLPTAATFGLIALLVHGIEAKAAELKVMAGAGMRGVFAELIPQFERVTGNKIVIQYAGVQLSGSRLKLVTSSTSSLSIQAKWMHLSSKAKLIVIHVWISSELA